MYRSWVFATTTAGRGAGVGVRQTLARASTGRGAQLSTISGHSEVYISFVARRFDFKRLRGFGDMRDKCDMSESLSSLEKNCNGDKVLVALFCR